MKAALSIAIADDGARTRESRGQNQKMIEVARMILQAEEAFRLG